MRRVTVDLRTSQPSGSSVLVYSEPGVTVFMGRWTRVELDEFVSFQFDSEELWQSADAFIDMSANEVRAECLEKAAELMTKQALVRLLYEFNYVEADGIREGREQMRAEFRQLLGVS